MSASVFPTFVGLTMDRDRTAGWSTLVQVAVSGKETRVARRNYPQWTWQLSFDILRSGPTFEELQSLAGFFNLRQGMFDSFLLPDPDDDAIVGQQLGIGDGATTTFQLSRAFGGFNEIIQAPNVVSNVYGNGTPIAGFTASTWGATSPGVITLLSAPANGVTITADFSYYWPVRFTDDNMTFTRFMNTMYEAKKVGAIQIL